MKKNCEIDKKLISVKKIKKDDNKSETEKLFQFLISFEHRNLILILFALILIFLKIRSKICCIFI